MATTAPVQYTIANGPSKYDLLIHGFSERNAVSITIKETGKSITCILNQVGYEDGSGNRFLLEGYVENQPQSTSFTAYCDVKSRTGWIKF